MCRAAVGRYGLALLLWAGLSAAWAALEPPVLSAELEKSTVYVGDEVRLKLTISLTGDLEHVKAENVDIDPPAGLTEDTSRTVTSQIQTDHPDGTATVVYTQMKYYKADKPGSFQFGPLELRYIDDGASQVARVAGPAIEVTDPYATPPAAAQPEQTPANPGVAASSEAEGLRDIKALEPAPFDFDLAFTITGSLLLLALAAAVFLVMRNRKRIQEPETAPVYVPPVGLLQRTLALLDEIPEPGSLEDPQAVADYYLAITDLAKSYMTDRYGLKATERTSWELKQEYRTLLSQRREEKPEVGVYLPAFQHLFELCDGGKYAHLHATRELMAEAKVRARTFFETDHRLPGGGTVPIGLRAASPLVPDPESAMTGAAAGMRIRKVADSGEFPEAKAAKPRGVPRATQMAEAALASPSTSGTLFTAADSAALVRQRAAAAPPADPPAA